MSENDAPAVNGTMSGSGDAHSQSDHQENTAIMSNSQDSASSVQNAGGDCAGAKKGIHPKLTRIPTITINDESENGDSVMSVIIDDDSIFEDTDRSINDSPHKSTQVKDTKSNNESESETHITVKSGKDSEGESDIIEVSPAEELTDPSKGSSESTQIDRSQSEPTEQTEDKPDEPLDILGNGFLIKKVVTAAGADQSRPVYGDQVTLRSEGRLTDGTVIDKYDTITFTLGDGDVIHAWDLCTALMLVGEVCELTTDAKYAYGSLGRSPNVPANAKVIYTLELLNKQDGLDIWKLSVEERLKYGDAKRERGNYLFGRSDYSSAINSYSKALKILNAENPSPSADISLLQQLLDVRMKCYNNIAAAQIKVDAFDAAIKSCDEVLKVQPENVKALFRKGKSHAAKGQTELAITVLNKALKLDPESKIVQQELFKQTKRLKKETQSEKEMYRKMFGSMQPSEPDKKKSKSIWKSWGMLASGALAVILLSVGIAVYRN